MTQLRNRYLADVRELQFVLFEHFKVQELFGQPPYEAWGETEARLILDEVYRFAREVTGPINQVGDIEGCRLVDGQVYTPTGFKEAWKALWEAGWKTLSAPEVHGGQGAPRTLHALVEELLSGSNTAFAMYASLANGAADVVDHFGTPRQRELYAQRMFVGTWGGTMCLTEPHAGSDVGAATTSALRRPDGTYAIRGTKIFISGGDHDLTDNVVHLVLARIEGAAPGTRGLSLFIVPKFRVSDDGSLGQRNDVKVASIEHKMGINGSSTCVLVFGEDDACIGELVGTVEHDGMRQMFVLMNTARIAVGIQGLSIASSAYLNALEYAKERKQGAHVTALKDASAPRAPIIDHPDVRRMLLDMRARVEGIRALVFKLSMHQDRVFVLSGKDDELVAYHQGQVDLLTPLVKAYGTDQAFRICDTAIQVFGGAGYLKDHPVEQYCRDAKIFTIYEGTNGIQAMDLVGRKLLQGGGRNARDFFTDIARFIGANRGHGTLGPSVELLAQAQEAVSKAAVEIGEKLRSGGIERVSLAAATFLEAMSELAVGFLLLDAAVIALARAEERSDDDPDRRFYANKRLTAVYFAQHVLPLTALKASRLLSPDPTPLEATW